MPNESRKRILERRRQARERFQGGHSRRRVDEDVSSKEDLETLTGSLFHEDSSSNVDGDCPPPGFLDDDGMSSTEPRYHQILASRLAELQLPVSDNGSSSLPSREILEALTRKSFHDDDLRAALVQYQIQTFLNETIGPDRDYGESDSAHVDMGSTYTEPDDGAITKEEHMEHCEVLAARTAEIDTSTKLDQEQVNQLYLKHALYRIKAALLLKGKPVEELDTAALEREYPPDLIVKNNYFFHFEELSFFGWYFDPELCKSEYLTDYQRLVLLNDNGGDEYTSWSRYRAYYSTPEADRDYLRYWETIAKKIKWLEQYVLTNESSIEWAHIRSKALCQAVRIASEFPDMTLELAAVGFHEYIWNARKYLMFVKDLDGIFYEIWKRLNGDHQNVQLRFRDALKQVYDAKLFPAQDISMKYELKYGDSNMDQVFDRCTKGISDSVPEYKARELIAQEIRCTRGSSGSYERYARKKLKIAELIGLIPKDKIAAV